MAKIVLQNVGKIYGNGVRAVNNLNLDVDAGACLVLVGPSGCGKSTTLRLIAGLENPTSGRILIDGRPIDDVPPWQRDVAMVFQKPALMPNRSVRANLTFGAELRRGLFVKLWRRLSAKGRAERVRENQAIEELARVLGLEEVLERRPGELSGGQLQRAALGRALLNPASIRLLDEPLGQLDGPLRRELRRELHLLQRRFQATIVHVTHDSEEALALGERIAVLHDGVLLQVDSAEALLSRPLFRFVAEFFPTDVGPLNFLRGRLLEEAGWPVCEVGQRRLRPADSQCELWRKNLGREIFLGVRPDDVCIQWQEIGPGGGWRMRVLLVENRGRGSLIVCEGHGLRIGGFMERPRSVGIGTEAAVDVHLERALLFDAGSGRNLSLE